MNGLWMVLSAAALMMVSGVPAGFGRRDARAMQWLAAALMLLGGLTGLAGLALALLSPPAAPLSLRWHLPWGAFSADVDALSAVFLIPVFTVPALGAVFGLAYWRQDEHRDNWRGLSLSYGLLAGAMALVVVARDAVLLLICWEVMALSAFFLTTTEDERPEVRRAGWVYLVATHAGTVCLLALFALWRQLSGSFALAPVAVPLTEGVAAALFVLTLIGFGFKAGIMPLHVWLPGAHANAPSHVSAVMSGVMLKMGVYGILRMLTLLPATALWNGQALLALGAATGVLGIAFAMGQRDIKRLLAYSSIENIGIITMGIGLAMMGRTLQRADFVLLGLGGALLHVVNHSLFKSLLFLNAGVVMHAVHTRDMNRMGGLAKTMPQTAALFILGAVAICGLPPLNGFASEWLIYMGLFQSVKEVDGVSWAVAGTGAASLALIGAMALACFVKMSGMVFLGAARGHGCPRDPSLLMRAPMYLLGAGCVALGVWPGVAMPLIRRAAGAWAASAAPAAEFPASVAWVALPALALLLASGFGVFLALRRLRRRPAAEPVGTWGCGYALPTPRMQYTADSFAEMPVRLFAWALRPDRRSPRISSPFPAASEFSIEVPDTLLERFVLPFFHKAGLRMMRLRLLQQGRITIYLLYILVITLVLLCWLTFVG